MRALLLLPILAATCEDMPAWKPIEQLGPNAYDLKCSDSIKRCHRSAYRVCPRGYNVKDGQGHGSEGRRGYNQRVNPFFRMVVECR